MASTLAVAIAGMLSVKATAITKFVDLDISVSVRGNGDNASFCSELIIQSNESLIFAVKAKG